MKVIEEGPGWNTQIRCTGSGNGNGGCKSLLEIDKNDLFETRHSDYSGDTEYYITIECTVCKEWTDLVKSTVPSAFQRNLKVRFPGEQTDNSAK